MIKLMIKLIKQELQKQQPSRDMHRELINQVDSMNSDELQSIQQSILEKDGPTLGQIHVSLSLYNFRNQLFTPMNSLNFIRSLPHNKDVKYIGSNQQAQLRAFYYVLLFLEIQQKKNYPYLDQKLHQILSEYNFKKSLTVKTSHISNESDPNKKTILEPNESHNKIIDEIDQKKVQKNKQIIQNYFSSVHELEQVEEYIKENKDFDQLCIQAMKDVLEGTYKKAQKPYETTFLFYQKLSRIFGIKFLLATASNENYRSYSFGQENRFYILSEGWYTFVVFHNVKIGKNNFHQSQQIQLQNKHLQEAIPINIHKERGQRPIASSAIVIGRNQVDLILTDSIQYKNGEPNLFKGLDAHQNEAFSHDFHMEKNKHNLQVPRKKRYSKEPRNSQGCLQLVIEASQQSTPKFLQQESQNRSSFAKYRKKSHKNSFGGDIEIVNYRDIEGSILNRQRQNKKRMKLRKSSIKVKSAKFQTQQIGQQFEFQDEETKKGSRRSNKNVTELPMWGSHCQPIIEKPMDQMPVIKKKKLSSSAAIPEDGQHQQQKLKNKERLSVVDSRHIANEEKYFNPRISFSRNEYNRFIQERNYQQHEQNYKKSPDHVGERHVHFQRGIKQKYQLDEIKRFYENIPIDQSKHTQPEADNSYQNFIRQYEQIVNLDTRNPQKNYQEIFASRKVHQSQHVEEPVQQSRVQSEIHDVIYNLLDPLLKSKLRSRKFSQFNTQKSPITLDDYYKVIGMNFLKKLQESKQMILRAQENSLNQSLFKSKSRAGDGQYAQSFNNQAISSPNVSTNSNAFYQPVQSQKIKRVQDINRVRQQQLKKRFEQNSIRFSQLNDPIEAMIIEEDQTPPRMSPTSTNHKNSKNQQFNNKRQYNNNHKNHKNPKLKLYSSIVTFQNFNSEPNDWIKKQTTFYFRQKPQQTRVICKNDCPNSYSMFSKKKPQNPNKKKRSKNKSKKKKQYSQDNPQQIKNDNQHKNYNQAQYKKIKQTQKWNKSNLSYLSEKEIIQHQIIQEAKERKYTYNYGEKLIQRKRNDSGYLNNSLENQHLKEQRNKKYPKSQNTTEKKFNDDPKNILLACPQSEIGFRNSDLKNRQHNINSENQEIHSYNKKGTSTVYGWQQFLIPSNASIQQDGSTAKGDSNNLPDKSISIPQKSQINYIPANRSYQGGIVQNRINSPHKQSLNPQKFQFFQKNNQFNQTNNNTQQYYMNPHKHQNVNNRTNTESRPDSSRHSPMANNIIPNSLQLQQNQNRNYHNNYFKNTNNKVDNFRLRSPSQKDHHSVSPIYSPKQIQFTYKVITPNQFKSPTHFGETKVMINRSADNNYQNYRPFPQKINQKPSHLLQYSKPQYSQPNHIVNNMSTRANINKTERFFKQY